MKKQLIGKAFCLGVVCCAAIIGGCRQIPPVGPLSLDPNDPGLTEPLPFYSDWFVFSETPDVFRVKLRTHVSDTVLGSRITEYMKGRIAKYNASVVKTESEPYDAIVSVDSKFRELTGAPKCRLYNITDISLLSARGERLCPPWEKKIDTSKVFASSVDGQRSFQPFIEQLIDTWADNQFERFAFRQYGVSILRIKTTREEFFEEDVYAFETEIRMFLDSMRQIPGVQEVRLIEADRLGRIASFRVVYQKARCPNGLLEILHSGK